MCTSCVATSSAFLAPTLVGLKLQANRLRRRRASGGACTPPVRDGGASAPKATTNAAGR